MATRTRSTGVSSALATAADTWAISACFWSVVRPDTIVTWTNGIRGTPLLIPAGQFDGAEPVKVGDDGISGCDRHRFSQRAGQDHLTGSEPAAPVGQGADQPRDRRRRMAEHRGPG